MQCVLMGLYRDLPLSQGGAKVYKRPHGEDPVRAALPAPLCPVVTCSKDCHPCHLPLSRGGAKFTKGHTVKTLSELRSLPPSVLWSLVPKTVTPVTCPCHEGESLKYCCEQCDTLLCQACTVDKDLGHQPRYLNRAAVAQHSCMHSGGFI